MLGKAWYDPDGNGGFVNKSDETPQIELLDVPGEAASHGIGTIELCHFHFESTDDLWLSPWALPTVATAWYGRSQLKAKSW